MNFRFVFNGQKFTKIRKQIVAFKARILLTSVQLSCVPALLCVCAFMCVHVLVFLHLCCVFSCYLAAELPHRTCNHIIKTLETENPSNRIIIIIVYQEPPLNHVTKMLVRENLPATGRTPEEEKSTTRLKLTRIEWLVGVGRTVIQQMSIITNKMTKF